MGSSGPADFSLKSLNGKIGTYCKLMGRYEMRILGIDPGYGLTGYCILDYYRQEYRPVDYGIISTKPNSYFPARLLKIEEALESLIQEFNPHVMAVEELFFSRNTTTAIATAQARGVAVVAGARHNLPVFEYTPMQVKLAVTGYGRADKRQVQEMVKLLLKLKSVPQPDDVADAIAIAICHAHTGNQPAALAGAGTRP